MLANANNLETHHPYIFYMVVITFYYLRSVSQIYIMSLLAEKA